MFDVVDENENVIDTFVSREVALAYAAEMSAREGRWFGVFRSHV